MDTAGNTSNPMNTTLDSTLPEPNDDETAATEDYNFEIKKMSDDADAILESIRREATTGKARNNNQNGKKRFDDDDMTDDGSLAEELKRQMIAELMAAELVVMDDGNQDEASVSTNKTFEPPVLTSSPQASLTKWTWLDKSLVILTSLIWMVALFLLVGPVPLLNEDGAMTTSTSAATRMLMGTDLGSTTMHHSPSSWS